MSILRDPKHGDHRVTAVELFFDLVYVLAVTQLTHVLVHHLSLTGVLETLVLMIAVWSAWMYTAWMTNWFDPHAMAVRLLLVGLMLLGLVMSSSLPGAFGERGLAFGAAFAALQLGRTVFVLSTTGRQWPARAGVFRQLPWWFIMGSLWVAGGFADHGLRLALWSAAVACDVVVSWNGYPIPGLGRSTPGDWNISGAHMAERCQLFIIIALGESILVTGARFGELPFDSLTAGAFLNAFMGSVALWWIYFDRTAEAGVHAITHDAVPDRLARSAYTFSHIPMVAGIIAAAAADELVLRDPGGFATPAAVALIVGGPALYLVGNSLFNGALTGRLPRSRLAAIGILMLLGLVGRATTQLGLSVAATVVILGLAAWDAWAGRGVATE